MIRILPGYDKDKRQEDFGYIDLEPGKVYSVVGPTGSGKTQLLDDIERLSPGDGVTKRVIESGQPPLIHHLSQKMHYMVDMKVNDFLALYGESTEHPSPLNYSREITEMANTLCGERIEGYHTLTRLSGGQSRALMIATVALSPESNVVLLDEIENAGINRIEVLKTLTTQNKVVIIITHDPLLALQADYRIVLKNGGIQDIIERTSYEASLCGDLTHIDNYLADLRARLRSGLSMEMEDDHERLALE